MKNRRLVIAAVIISASINLAKAQGQAQQPTSGAEEVNSSDDPRKFFQVSLSDGGKYMVALGRITSIAKHEYLVDGAVRVHEVSITAEGSTITRFYFLEPVTENSPSSAGQVIIDRVRGTTKEVSKRTGTEDALNAVSKSYPHGTHTHNIEYRLKNKANVSQLYSSLQSAWYNGKGKKVSIQVSK
jgi:hypothetical protein